MLAGKRALVMGIGLHGGGVATAKWLARRGVRVTATDLRDRTVLADSIRALGRSAETLVLGEHRMEDFRTHDLVVVNPAVPRESQYLRTARESGKQIENDCSLFFRAVANPVIAVTGTRGKTTTTLWIAELLKDRFPLVRPSGNTPENALLKEFDRIKNHPETPAVAELSSWQLEFLPETGRAPQVAIVTNLYPDHLNRYDGQLAEYAKAKAGIFVNQTMTETLVLNADDPAHVFFEERAQTLPHGPRILMASVKGLPTGASGVFVRAGVAYVRTRDGERRIVRVDRFCRARGEHNLSNLLLALAGALAFESSIRVTEAMILALPNPPMRQEIILDTPRMMVVNDSCATSPDGVIAAIERFRADAEIVLIAGGTDKALEFGALARVIGKHIPPARLVLLEGSATRKLQSALSEDGYATPSASPDLAECVALAFSIARASKKKTCVLFSPGAASFEKFLHEFDRGKKFATLAKREMK